MSRLVRAWARYHRRRAAKADRGADRRARWPELIERLAPGRSFADIGGMYQMHGGVAFDAEAAGATSVTVFDGMDPTPEFEAEHERRGSSVRFVQGDLHERASVELLGEHDVVWCTGVLYHTPNPYLQIDNLRWVCRETLLLGTYVIPELPGFAQAAVLYPGMRDEQREAQAAIYVSRGERIGVELPFDHRPHMAYAGWWWGITPSALTGMLRTAGFEVIEEMAPTYMVRDVLCRVGDRPHTTPPPDFARRRGLERLERLPEGELPRWAP